MCVAGTLPNRNDVFASSFYRLNEIPAEMGKKEQMRVLQVGKRAGKGHAKAVVFNVMRICVEINGGTLMELIE